MPNKQKLLQAQKRVGFKKIKFHPNEKKVALQTPGMILDMGGIAKGYAADRMLSAMRANGITRCLIDAGGDLVIGKPPRGKRAGECVLVKKLKIHLRYYPYPNVLLPHQVMLSNPCPLAIGNSHI